MTTSQPRRHEFALILAVLIAASGSACSGSDGTGPIGIGGSAGVSAGGAGGSGAGGSSGTAGASAGSGGGSGIGGAAGSAGRGGGAGGTGGSSAGDGSAGVGGAAGRAGSAGAGVDEGGLADAARTDAARADGTGGRTDASSDDDSGGCAAGDGGTSHFSFFVTSLQGIRRLSGNQDGFGGDLRFGKADGLSGADEICRQLADSSFPGAGCKTWRAFLSVTKDTTGNPVHAVDRIGNGPWYDRTGRLVATTKDDLMQPWPRDADPAIKNDLPNEFGVPNHNPDGTGIVDNHNTLTGTGDGGKLFNTDWAFTCHDWTSTVGTDGTPHIGFCGNYGAAAFGGSWFTGLFNEGGCAPGINLTDANDLSKRTVGSSGGYGGFYCLALTP